MTHKTPGFYVSAGLLTPEHMHRIGPALREFLWLISHETREEGRILNGTPITSHRIAAELGEHRNTASRNLARLEREGYISREHGKGYVYSYRIANSKKWIGSYTENGAATPAATVPAAPEMVHQLHHKRCSSCTTNGARNKEVDKEVDIVDKNPSAKGAGKCANPSPKKEVDPRHLQVREFIRACYAKANPGLPAMPWNPRAAGELTQLLKANPSWTAEQLCRCVVHRFESTENHAKQPSEWIPKLPSYAAGPLDEYGKPKGGNNGNRNRAQQRQNSNLAALNAAFPVDR